MKTDRRGFLAGLLALPFVRVLVPEPAPETHIMSVWDAWEAEPLSVLHFRGVPIQMSQYVPLTTRTPVKLVDHPWWERQG